MKNEIIRSKPYYKGLNKDFQSPTQDTKLTYLEGMTVEADGLNDDPNDNCGQGINFCATLAHALRWGATVVEITVPDGEPIVWAGDKLRAKRVMVGKTIDLYRANLYRANLAGAILSGADLTRADLTGAYLFVANLAGANLTDAILAGANLYGANLSGADFTRADLTRADLTGADLYGANLYGADLTGAKGNELTRLPDGWKVNDSGFVVKG